MSSGAVVVAGKSGGAGGPESGGRGVASWGLPYRFGVGSVTLQRACPSAAGRERAGVRLWNFVCARSVVMCAGNNGATV